MSVLVGFPVPGMTWAMDGTEIGPMLLLQVQDLASRYKYEPFVASSVCGEQVAEQLERLIGIHGPPLILKRDRGGNLRHEAVQAVLQKYLIVPLDSPPWWPMNPTLSTIHTMRTGTTPTRPSGEEIRISFRSIWTPTSSLRPVATTQGR